MLIKLLLLPYSGIFRNLDHAMKVLYYTEYVNLWKIELLQLDKAVDMKQEINLEWSDVIRHTKRA